MFKLPAAPTSHGWSAAIRIGPGLTAVFAPGAPVAANDQRLAYYLFNDQGTLLAPDSISTGSVAFSTPTVYSFRNPSGGVTVVAAEVDGISHSAAVFTGTVSKTGETTAGPCGPTPTIFPQGQGYPFISGISYDLEGGRFYFTGVAPGFIKTGFFTTDSACRNATSPVALGDNAGQTLPVVAAVGGGKAVVFGSQPAPNNDQRNVAYKVDYSGSPVAGFTTWSGPPGGQAFATRLFVNGSSMVGIGDVGGTVSVPFLDLTTGAPNPAVTPNPLMFMTTGATFSYPQWAEQASPGTFVVGTNDSNGGGGLTVIVG
jgi:hypothetical protein